MLENPNCIAKNVSDRQVLGTLLLALSASGAFLGLIFCFYVFAILCFDFFASICDEELVHKRDDFWYTYSLVTWYAVSAARASD
jgi:hypothetical protein